MKWVVAETFRRYSDLPPGWWYAARERFTQCRKLASHAGQQPKDAHPEWYGSMIDWYVGTWYVVQLRWLVAATLLYWRGRLCLPCAVSDGSLRRLFIWEWGKISAALLDQSIFSSQQFFFGITCEQQAKRLLILCAIGCFIVCVQQVCW